MNQYKEEEYNRQVYYRLIALWVICEAFAGGIMHAANIPLTGMIVSSLAVICIVLIGYYYPAKASVIKATIIVAVFKLMLSPHSPPTAYIAVGFQGLMGQLLISRRYIFAGSIALAILSLVESAIQRLLVLVIVYGNEFPEAVNLFIKKLTNQKELTDHSFHLALIYVLAHGFVGIFIGIYAATLAKRSAEWKEEYPGLIIQKDQSLTAIVTKKNERRRKLKIAFIFIFLALLVLYAHAYFNPANAVIPSNIVIRIILRSILILLAWHLVVAPMVMFLIKRLLNFQQLKYQQEINQVMLLLPQTRYIFKEAFNLSANRRGLRRMKFFLQILLVNILSA